MPPHRFYLALLALLYALMLCAWMAEAFAAGTGGTASLTHAERQVLVQLAGNRETGGGIVLDKILRDADKTLTKPPHPFANIITSGEEAKGSGAANSKGTETQAADTWRFALAYAAIGKQLYAEQAKQYLLAWAQENHPSGDSVAGAKFVPMFRAYDLLRDMFTVKERQPVEHWISATADAVITDQERARAKNDPRGFNNHRSHALLIIATAGAVLGNDHYIAYVTGKSGYLDHIRENLRNYEGEPDGFGYDYHERKAVHYVAYNLQALGKLAILLDRLRRLQGNPYDIAYDPYTVDEDGASLLHTLRTFLPYATGEKQAASEFAGSTNPRDVKRIESGKLKRNFDRHDAIAALESAYYFYPVVQNGHSYDLAAIAADIEREKKGHLSLPEKLPTPGFLISHITSPYKKK